MPPAFIRNTPIESVKLQAMRDDVDALDLRQRALKHGPITVPVPLVFPQQWNSNNPLPVTPNLTFGTTGTSILFIPITLRIGLHIVALRANVTTQNMGTAGVTMELFRVGVSAPIKSVAASIANGNTQTLPVLSIDEVVQTTALLYLVFSPTGQTGTAFARAVNWIEADVSYPP